MNTRKFVVVDIETTGHAPAKGDRIIQLAMVTIENDRITDTYMAFVNPGKAIPRFIQDLTGITERDVQDAGPFEDVAAEVFDRLQDAVFVAHNVQFDLPFLQQELTRAGYPKWQGLAMDTVELTRLAYPTAYSYKLQDICSEQGIHLKNAHRADDDALATAELFLKGRDDLRTLPCETLELLHKRSFQLKSDLSRLLFDLIREKRTSGEVYGYRFQNIPLKMRMPIEGSALEPVSLSGDWHERMSRVFPKFEPRESQFKMMAAVEKSLEEQEELVIEASTGMGKTLGYLLPAVNYALESGKQVLISTYTTHLQDQLLQKEGKIVGKFFDAPIRFALVKGLGNYLDLHRFAELLQGDDESYDETFTLMQILIWLMQTETGDLNELNASSGGQLVLDKIRRSHFRKLTKHDSAYDFYEYAMAKAKNAHVVVTNHAFLLNQRVSERALTESAGAIIFDEAHQIVQTAVSQYEKSLVYTQWKYVFGQIGIFEDQQLYSKLYEIAEARGFASIPELLRLEGLSKKIFAGFDQLAAELTFHFTERFAGSRHKKNSVLLEELPMSLEGPREILRNLNEWIDLSQIIMQKAERLHETSLAERLVLTEWRYWTEEIMVKTENFGEIFIDSTEHGIAWVDGDLRSLPNSLTLYKRPFEVREVIDGAIGKYRGQLALIWLSGTMSVPSNDRFITNQLGVPESVSIEKFDPPIGFYEGAQVFLVEDMPEIQKVSQREWIESVADAVIQTVLVTEGRCFVLFTSQDMLRKTVELIQDTGLLDDYMLFAQGISSGSRMRLLKSFQRFKKSVLFGTNSFWEGVDVPGDALRAVIVVRLPFTSPEEPIFKARCEAISKEGKNPFLHYALPEAVLRLRQGFGRLIRSKDDQGLFIVLDRRIETKSYGHEFISALPKVEVVKGPLEKMVTDIEAWYNEQ
ncbi:ATP-dependent DNA helicase DinG [Planomicrobium sp. YIM 101495]|uniref:ATP-dependent DNA helicase DinG n=1 Tax=Planomicrobium sp. YIM 101495 TaxID=2665160 RepID=UPI0012B761DE|nr:ATP-dependent DNA helicase DinG [Planomicrobium sp. YIM 101495]MTD30039.1 ATP-dependent DNA helicase DinG [Planomicrobium sp. YIM 101495]